MKKQHVEELLLEDKEFQKEVAFWEKQLAPMIDTIENVEPPSNSFEKIMTRVQALPSNVLTVDFKQKVQFWKVFSYCSEYHCPLFICDNFGERNYTSI